MVRDRPPPAPAPAAPTPQPAAPAHDGKADAGKPRWGLLPWRALEQVVRVRMYGVARYGGDEGWRGVPDGRRRYADALLRHVVAWLGGERADADSGLHHLAHAACNALFLLALDTESEGESGGAR